MKSLCGNKEKTVRIIPVSKVKFSDRDIPRYHKNHKPKKFDFSGPGLDCYDNDPLHMFYAEIFFMLIERLMLIIIYS